MVLRSILARTCDGTNLSGWDVCTFADTDVYGERCLQGLDCSNECSPMWEGKKDGLSLFDTQWIFFIYSMNLFFRIFLLSKMHDVAEKVIRPRSNFPEKEEQDFQNSLTSETQKPWFPHLKYDINPLIVWSYTVQVNRIMYRRIPRSSRSNTFVVVLKDG